jgi:ABC-type lipoprotein export system ATPase subunit
VLALDLLEGVCAEVGAALLVATHDPVVRARFRRVIEIVRPPVHLRRHHRNAGAPVAHAGPP